MSLLGLFNFLILQWFFIRLAKIVENNKITGWKILKGIIPLSGWWSNYKYIKREKKSI